MLKISIECAFKQDMKRVEKQMKILVRFIEPKQQIEEHRKIFTNSFLIALIIPLFIEQLLAMLVGIADTLMVSYAGEAAVSGVTLVNMFVTIFIYVFTSLAAGGAVVVSQYIGSKDQENGDLAASQLLLVSMIISVGLMLLVTIFHRPLIQMLFGQVEPKVMESSITYLKISAFSFPGLAIYSSGAAIYRSMGKTKVTLQISIFMNVVNVIGNAIGIFVLHAGVAGVAWPSFLARTLGGIIIVILAFRKNNLIRFEWKKILRWNQQMIKRIMGIAIPNGIESGMFQIAKVALSAIVALFGTSQIAANGVAQSFWSMAALVGVAMGSAYITIVGRCMGNGDHEVARYYMIKLLKITMVTSILWNGLILLVVPLILKMYDLSVETKQMVFYLVVIHNLFNAFVFPISAPFANGLRAAGDVKYNMYVSIFATVVCRVALSILFGIYFHLGVIGIALAMGMDWCIRAALVVMRYRSGKWTRFKII